MSKQLPGTGPLYERLQVRADAPHEEIIRAYRRLAHGVHPDIHPEDPEAAQHFREITEAYDVLSDPERRSRYDRNRAIARPWPVVPDGNRARRVVVSDIRRRSPAPPIQAGPVHVQPTMHDPSGAGADAQSELASLLRDVLEFWNTY